MESSGQRPPEALLWATDVHLDHLPPEGWHEFGASLREAHPESRGLVLTGDIGDAPRLRDILELVQASFGGTVYFVLGNHDFYRGSFMGVETAVQRLVEQVPGLLWLREQIVWLAPSLALVGADGWYDARNGNPKSELKMSDFVLIEDLFSAQDESHEALLRVLRGKADRCASILAERIAEAVSAGATRVIVATHVPPFLDSAHYNGDPPNDTWAPFFTSQATGDCLRQAAEASPEVKFTVLCGHTHSACAFAPCSNMIVYTGAARYGHPRLAARLWFSPESSVRVDPSPPEQL